MDYGLKVYLNVENAEAFLQAARGMADSLEKGLREWVVLTGNAVRRRAVENLSGKVLKARTARLRSSVVVTFPSETEAVIGTNVFYGKSHELGLEIRAKKSLMSFKVEGSDRLIFARKITLPERPWLRPAVDDEAGPAEERLRSIVRAIQQRHMPT